MKGEFVGKCFWCREIGRRAAACPKKAGWLEKHCEGKGRNQVHEAAAEISHSDKGAIEMCSIEASMDKLHDWYNYDPWQRTLAMHLA